MLRLISARAGRAARPSWRHCGKLVAMSEPEPRSLAEFEINFHSALGSGTCGSVYSGLHRDTHREVAIKVVSPALPSATEEDLATGIVQERQVFEHVLQAGASHPHVVDLVTCFQGPCSEAAEMGLEVPKEAEEEHLHYFVMERLSTESLADRIESGNGLDEEAVKEATRSISQGLSFLHERGIVHRDVKPANVLYTQEASHSDLKLIDFSHSGVVPDSEDPNSQCLESTLGTAGYVAPEVLAGKEPYSAKCDVYSLGCTVHAMLAGGRLPRRHPRLGIMTSLPESASPEATQFLGTLLCPEPEDRPSIPEVLTSPWLR